MYTQDRCTCVNTGQHALRKLRMALLETSEKGLSILSLFWKQQMGGLMAMRKREKMRENMKGGSVAGVAILLFPFADKKMCGTQRTGTALYLSKNKKGVKNRPSASSDIIISHSTRFVKRNRTPGRFYITFFDFFEDFFNFLENFRKSQISHHNRPVLQLGAFPFCIASLQKTTQKKKEGQKSKFSRYLRFSCFIIIIKLHTRKEKNSLKRRTKN